MLTSCTILSFLASDEKVIRAGDRELNGMYLLMGGKVDVFTDEYDYEKKICKSTLINEIQQGQYFGEIALLCDAYRTADCISNGYAMLGKLTLEHLYTLATTYPSIRKVLFNQTLFYNDAKYLFLMSSLRKVDYLNKANDVTIRLLAYSMKPL